MSYPPVPAPGPTTGRRPRGHLWFLLVPIFTAGLGAFALPLWAMSRVRSARKSTPAAQSWQIGASTDQPRPHIPVNDTRLVQIAAALAAASLLTFTLMGLAPTDTTGASTGPLANVATALALLLVAAGVLLALRWRDDLFPPHIPPHIAALNAARVPEPIAQAAARRNLREQYRRLTVNDPVLARELGVGRPDKAILDDGGLIDLNALEVAHLVEHAELPAPLAAQIVELRERHGGLSSVDEIVVYTPVPDPVQRRLREYAVFL